MAEERRHAAADGRRTWADRETLLDLVVNVVPMVILLFFALLFTVIRPWTFDPAAFTIMHFLTLFPLAVLVVLTYVAAKVISRDERRSAEADD